MRGAFWCELARFGGGWRLEIGRGCGELGAGGNDDVLNGFNPFATVVEAGAGVDGTKDGVWAGSGVINILDQEFGGAGRDRWRGRGDRWCGNWGERIAYRLIRRCAS
jgi:hypothetical protein